MNISHSSLFSEEDKVERTLWYQKQPAQQMKETGNSLNLNGMITDFFINIYIFLSEKSDSLLEKQ